MGSANREWIIWGSELSPFTLKVIRLYQQAGIPHRLLPAHGGRLEVLRHAWRKERLVRGHLPLTAPRMEEEDEFPLVPFVFGPDGENLYDSSAIARWLDRDRPAARRFVPVEPVAAFLVHLIDEFADEWGLYLAHHNRWVVSARDNDAGRRVTREFRHLLGPLQGVMADRFAARQTRRLPYLFSVAPAGTVNEGLAAKRQPPAPDGFPPTHALLDEAFDRLIAILEALLQQRPFLLGRAFTLADASVYGELGINLDDLSANALVRQKAPTLHRWLIQLRSDAVMASADDADSVGDLSLLAPLIAEIRRCFLPLMQQNYRAYVQAHDQGQTRFNEAAFDHGEALYDGEIDGHPYRSVAKSFQAKVWRELCQHWRALSRTEQDTLGRLGLSPQDFRD